MSAVPTCIAQDMENLGLLAMKFRRTRIDAERQNIAKEYSQAVERLVNSGCWQEMPAFEDQLPNDWMPKSFFDYWLRSNKP